MEQKKRRRLSKGQTFLLAFVIVFIAIAAGVFTGGPAKADQCSLGGRNAGIYVPCDQTSSDQVKKLVGGTALGCLFGVLTGTWAYGCAGGVGAALLDWTTTGD
jgi:hypothetical protein